MELRFDELVLAIRVHILIVGVKGEWYTGFLTTHVLKLLLDDCSNSGGEVTEIIAFEERAWIGRRRDPERGGRW